MPQLSRRELLGLLSSMGMTAAIAESTFAQQQLTFAQLPANARTKVNLSLRRSSDSISSSPFATVISFEAQDQSRDGQAVQLMQLLGVKNVLIYNAEKQLGDAKGRLRNMLNACGQAGIAVGCKIGTADTAIWKAAAQNYGEQVHSFYYLNEPNVPKGGNFANPAVNPEDYVAGLARVRSVLKNINRDIQVYGPECALLQSIEANPYPWVARAIDVGLLDAIDGFSFHPYHQGYTPANPPEKPSTFGGRPTTRYSTYLEQIAILRDMVRGKPLLVTEVGWSTTKPGSFAKLQAAEITELTQAKYALRQQVLDFAAGMKLATYFLLLDRPVGKPFPQGHIENTFGIVRADGTPKLSYSALQALYAQLTGSSRPIQNVNVSFSRSGITFFAFEDTSQSIPVRKLVYWLPIPAKDDADVQQAGLQLGSVTVQSLPVSDTPRILQIHKINNRWGYPVLFNLVENSAVTNINWQ